MRRASARRRERRGVLLLPTTRSTAAPRQACAALGFIEVDAECLARAWQAQTQRTGAFDAQAWPEHPADFGMRPFPPTARADAFPPCPERLGLYAVLPDAALGRPHGARRRADGAAALQVRTTRRPSSAKCMRPSKPCAAPTPCSSSTTTGRLPSRPAPTACTSARRTSTRSTPQELQAIRASGLRLGVSTHGYAEMVRADAVSPSYIAMGAVYPTTLKQMATAPQGVARLAAYARLMRGYPQVGIGGVDAERLPEVLATGVGSVAVVRALVAEPDPEAAAARLMKAMAARLQNFFAHRRAAMRPGRKPKKPRYNLRLVPR